MRKKVLNENILLKKSWRRFLKSDKQSLIGISEMEKLMGKKEFSEVLGALVYKP